MSGWPSVKIVLAAMFVIVCWAYSPIGIRIGLQAYEPGHLALLRFLIASIFMAIVALFMGISLPRLKDFPLLAILGFFCRHTASHCPEFRPARGKCRGGQCPGAVHTVIHYPVGSLHFQGSCQLVALGLRVPRHAWSGRCRGR